MTEPGIIVIDIPESATPGEASQALNAPGDTYFLVQVLPVSGGHRAYLRRYKQTPTKAETAKDGAGATALSIVRANRDKPIRTIVGLLAAAGIKRGRQWVCEQLDATCAEDGREAEALAILKSWPNDSPEDAVLMLRTRKIKRSPAWVRRKREELAGVVLGGQI